MICLRKINNQEIFINCDLIRYVEQEPDTVVTFVDGKRIIVKNAPEEIYQKILKFKKESHPNHEQ